MDIGVKGNHQSMMSFDSLRKNEYENLSPGLTVRI